MRKGTNQQAPRALLRDQERARLAYAKVSQVDERERSDYRTAVRQLGTNVRRLGLAGTLSVLEGKKDNGSRSLLEHIAAADISGLSTESSELARKACELHSLTEYMLASRELLRLAAWFNRAVQAMIPEGSNAG